MAYQLEGEGLEVDGVRFGLVVPTITEEALKAMQQEESNCNCELLDDDLLEAGSTCYPCYELMRDNPKGWNK